MRFTQEDRLLLARLTHADRATSSEDDTLLGLLECAQSGDHEAGERVLAVMAFRLAGVARGSLQTPFAQYVSAAWFVIAAFNLDRRTKVLTNLVMDTLKQVTRDRVGRWDLRTIPDPDPELWDLPALTSGRPERSAARGVLYEASRRRLIDERTRSVLEAVYLDGLSGKEAAARVGQSHDMVRYRCSRALRLLRQHQDELVGATC